MRKIYSKEERMKIYADWKISGLSQYGYCAREGINIKTFGNWHRNFKKQSLVNAVKFLAVGKIEPKIGVEIILPNKICVRIEAEKGYLADLLKEFL